MARLDLLLGFTFGLVGDLILFGLDGELVGMGGGWRFGWFVVAGQEIWLCWLGLSRAE